MGLMSMIVDAIESIPDFIDGTAEALTTTVEDTVEGVGDIIDFIFSWGDKDVFIKRWSYG